MGAHLHSGQLEVNALLLEIAGQRHDAEPVQPRQAPVAARVPMSAQLEAEGWGHRSYLVRASKYCLNTSRQTVNSLSARRAVSTARERGM